MARFKDYNFNQVKLIPVSFEQQILPGTFEYSLAYLVEHELDLSIFDSCYRNDYEGRPAYDPAILLKVIIMAYSRGITSSRRIEQLCRENVTFIALSADSQPHFSTVAHFISAHSEQIAGLFKQVVLICDDLGLIGKEMFAIDGCKLPSNASKEWSGTHSELKAKHQKIDRAVRRILAKHRRSDLAPAIVERDHKQIKKLRAASRKIKHFLATTTQRIGHSGREVKSNITDNESAKMKTSHGVVQGYTGVATVDSAYQVVVQAQAHGQGQEHGLLEPSLAQAHGVLNHTRRQKRTVKVTADSGYHDEKALTWLHNQGIDGYIADTGFRSRDPRFKEHKAPANRNQRIPKKRFTREDFDVDMRKLTCVCPAGKVMWLKNRSGRIGHHLFMQYQAYEKDGPECPLRSKCLRRPGQHTPRQLNIKLGITKQREDGVLEAMKGKIDSDEGRSIYSQRLGTVEPVFGNITHMLGFKRFSLRGQAKVNGQWQFIAMIHNIFKIHRYGWAR